MSVTSSSANGILDYVYTHFIRGAAAQKGSKPGFAHALQLSFRTIDRQRLSVASSDSLTYRFRTSPHIPKLSMGLLTALMDELSTVACFRVGLPSPPGVSLHMSTERTLHPPDATPASLESLSEVDVVNTVTKLGKTVAHTRTEYRCPRTQQVVASSTHVKYMPTGSMLMDWVFSSRWAQSLYHDWFLKSAKLPLYDDLSLLRQVLQPHLDYRHDGTNATFTVTELHTNPFGALHGGCHVVVMEMVATVYARHKLNVAAADDAADDADDDALVLEALQVEFLGAAKLGTTYDVVCTVPAASLPESASSSSSTYDGAKGLQVVVQLKHPKTGRVASEGRLRFIRNVV